MQNVHIPVLLQETLRGLEPTQTSVVLDATAGGGGHSKYIADTLSRDGVLIALDQDEDAEARIRERLKDAPCTVHVIQGNFKDLDTLVENAGYHTLDRILFDLGLSTNQLELSGRGFSFQRDEPLLMTMAKESETSAYQIVNGSPEKDLADLIYLFGEERYSRRIASAIVTRRAERAIGTSGELAEIIEQAVPQSYAKGRINPATRTFQALRIAANDELANLKTGLEKAWKMLAPQGRIAVISFHSLEDRIVKQFFASLVREGKGELFSKKPIGASETEIRENPKSRSAKLRIIKKII